jgi:hypothetical protein
MRCSTTHRGPNGEVVESFAAHQFEVRFKVRSIILPGRYSDEVVGYKCPRCGCKTPEMGHGSKHDCECGIHIELWGNGLCCSRPNTEAKQ